MNQFDSTAFNLRDSEYDSLYRHIVDIICLFTEAFFTDAFENSEVYTYIETLCDKDWYCICFTNCLNIWNELSQFTLMCGLFFICDQVLKESLQLFVLKGAYKGNETWHNISIESKYSLFQYWKEYELWFMVTVGLVQNIKE